MPEAVHFAPEGDGLTVETARRALCLWLGARQQKVPFTVSSCEETSASAAERAELHWLELEPDARSESASLPDWATALPAIEESEPSPWGQWSGRTAVAELRELGVLPEAFINYLALLGWQPPPDPAANQPREILSRDELLALWSPQGFVAAPVRFDFELLRRINHHWLQRADLDRLVALALPYYRRVGWLPEPLPELIRRWLRDVIRAVLPGLDFISLLPPRTRLVFDYQPETCLRLPESRAAVERAGARAVIRAFGLRALADSWLSVERFAEIVEEVKHETHCTGRSLLQPIRVMLTGLPFGPKLDDLIPIIERGAELGLPVRVKPCRERVLEFCSIFT